ncbi:putative GDP GTP exchange factor Sec2p [Rosellinia necatrix]|uniref:Putative GDP GTP exchange factor Sec2p n=1 Tax=Rosellinia necatrix TaxID=77044 RepID=A0A1W2TEZ3_ROSNE|nr:putative GDP GTP exchange factor Sec2p [Rosellinia necatrix]
MVPNDSSSLAPPQIRRMPSAQSLMEDADHSTLPDPRARSMSSTDAPANPVHHPDLDQEVATLSTKLINAINHQTTLDDTLSVTRQELDTSRDRIRELEALVTKQQEILSGDAWVPRRTLEAESKKLVALVTEEKNRRVDVEKEKKKIEQELETLTVSLFEEANKMVITAKEDAKKEQEILHRKNEQLKAQLADTEGLLKSQQEQLAQLKLVMEQMAADHDDHSGTTPSSPGFSKFDPRDDETQISEAASQSGVLEPIAPTYPTNLPHIVHPILRTDLNSYEDFLALIKTSRRTSSRVSSGSYTGLPILNFTGNSAITTSSSASSASLSAVGTPTSTTVSPQTPNTPASAISTGSAVSSTPLPPLKETKFYKRVLAEDIEPTLRLDIAPGLSWLARRSVLSAMTEGTLVVEPIPTNSPFASISRPQFYPCSLCGEARKDEPHLRNHRFRTSESESAQRYPLCQYCLTRVRSTCGFLGFLRMVKDGHWRADNADSERAAWEESVRLRDQMFWSRIGGGVVPIRDGHLHPTVTGEKMARNSHEATQPTGEGDATGKSSGTSRVSTSSCMTLTSDEQSKGEKTPTPVLPTLASRSNIETVMPHGGDQLQTSTTEPSSHLGDKMAEQEKDRSQGQRLSLTIPGAFGDETLV